jgi:hypothetical protein
MRKRYVPKNYILKRTVPDTKLLLHRHKLECIRKNLSENSEDTRHFQSRVRQRKITDEEVRKLRKEGVLIELESDNKDVDNPLLKYKLSYKANGGYELIGIFQPVDTRLIGITLWIG